MEAINRLAKPSYLNVIEQMERTIEPIRRQQMEKSAAPSKCLEQLPGYRRLSVPINIGRD